MVNISLNEILKNTALFLKKVKDSESILIKGVRYKYKRGMTIIDLLSHPLKIMTTQSQRLDQLNLTILKRDHLV
ncbi:MAG: hypothetical protein KJ666_18450 [Bacteroidetes bacterium]|nr:hypothetical protein [Bacteroidota bacterium]